VIHRLTVLSFNIALGGDIVDLAGVAEVIRRSGATVAGLQECGGNAARIAALLGWAHVDERSQVLSRVPLLPTDDPGTVLVQPAPGQVFALGNVHLPSDPYGPYLLRDGMSTAKTVDAEVGLRLAALERHFPAWWRWTGIGAALVVTGDFNAPSHRDWGSGAVEHRAEEVAWPVSLAAEALGLVDTYRHAHPKRAGITWTHGFPYPLVDPDELKDRIDFVWASGATVISSSLMGPSGAPDIDIDVDPWPSDHLAVATELEVPLVEPPPMAAPLTTRYERGDRITVRFHAAPTDRIVLGRMGTEVAWLPPMEAHLFGSVGFGTTTLEPGEYEVTLMSGDRVIDRRPVWVVDHGAKPAISAAAAGDTLAVSWEGAPARAYDWVGVYRAGDPDLYNGSVDRIHTGATVTGSHLFTSLEPGRYTVRLLTDDTCIVVAETAADVSG
jgi:hypothetical protein